MSLAVISKSEKSEKSEKSDSNASTRKKSGHKYHIVNKVFVYANKLVNQSLVFDLNSLHLSNTMSFVFHCCIEEFFNALL